MYICIVSEIFFWRQDKLRLPAIFGVSRIMQHCVSGNLYIYFECTCISWKMPTLLFLV